ncbi:MAG: peptidoglycan DD-metalloendopeptidase family protein [Bacteroidetes bacterium]|nr:peptidoglycan DD-metalloendopeptidase family protein [Bacteroidota bacterium]
MKKYVPVIMCILFWGTSCNDKYPIDELPDDTTPPSLTYPFLSFSSTKQFITFGDTLNGELCKGYWFEMLDSNQNVAAAASGIVTGIADQTGGAKSISVKYKANSIYSFVYANLRDVQVDINDAINPGTLLGKTGQGGKLYFQLIKNDNEVFCPQTFGSPGFNTAIGQAISKHNINYPSDTIAEPCSATSLPR